MVDGIPISNNENMQNYGGNIGGAFSPNSYGSGFGIGNGFNGYFNNANYGADLRQIPVENIESVEVIQGFPRPNLATLLRGLLM